MQLALFALAHAAIDLVLTMVPPLLPLLVRDLGFTVAKAGLLAALPSLVNGLGMPVFGHLVDRRGRGWMLPFTLVGAAVAMAGFAFVDGFLLLAVLTVLAGTSGSFFHPVTAVMVRAVAGDRVAPAMSVFSLGGTVGMAVSPVLTVAAVGAMGRTGIVWITLVPVAVAALAVLMGVHRLQLPRLPSRKGGPAAQPGATAAGAGEPEADPRPREGEAVGPVTPGAPPGMLPRRAARAFTMFAVGTFLRTQVLVVLTTFLPLYYVSLGFSDQLGGKMLSLFYVAGSAGSLLGAYLADRVGRRPLVLVSLLLSTPCLLGFLMVPSLGTLFLVLSGIALFATFSAGIVYGQELLPTNPGLAAGIIMGFVWGVCGFGLTPIGWAADQWGIGTVLKWLAWLPVLAFPFMVGLPETSPRRQVAGGPVSAPAR